MNYSNYLTIADADKNPGDPFAISLHDEVKQVESYLMNTFFSFVNTQPISTVFDYLDYHFRQYNQRNPGNETSFLSFVRECTRGNGMVETDNGKMLKMYKPIYESRGETIRKWIEKKEKEIETSTVPDKGTDKPLEKIKWKGKPAQFAYLFLELVKHGFIEPPLYNGELNFTGLSRLCYQYFDIETTPGNLTKEMKPDNETGGKGARINTLSNTNRAKFTIPDLSDLA